MRTTFKVKNANKTVSEVLVNGLRQIREKDYTLTKDAIKVRPGLDKGESLTFVQAITITV